MTSLIAWIGIDSRRPSSIYMASDSRLSWAYKRDKHNKIIQENWDHGRKLFASRNYPEILGYLGHAPFPSHILGQIIDLIDAHFLFSIDSTPQEKIAKITSTIKTSLEGYPHKSEESFTIVYCTRYSSKMSSQFFVATISWDLKKGWKESDWLDLPSHSDVIEGFGSGKNVVDKWRLRWNNTKSKGTSRIVFSAFCDALQSNEDNFTGGSPQLVGIHRIGSAKSFGVIYKNQRYLMGVPVEESENLSSVEWMNNLFERCDWKTMKLLPGAQVHYHPKGLGL